MNNFTLIRRDNLTRARLGLLDTPHGSVETPFFMPVGTLATVKALTPEEILEAGGRVILANAYHLHLRPGVELIRKMGGLHRFMHWDRTILTDSGGFQLYSLADFRKISEEGVHFRSHLDGSMHFITPEMAVEIQEDLGADIMMCLDECLGYPATRKEAEESMRLTLRWARRCRRAKKTLDRALFGIVQGGMHADLRSQSAEETREIGFDGYAVGGVCVGEPKSSMMEILDQTLQELPVDRPRYVMGVGAPEDLVECVALGADMFDCVLPTRGARNGLLLTRKGRLSIKNARYASDESPVDESCQCYTCKHYSRAYLRHLYQSKEILAMRLNTVHNLFYILELMQGIRESIREGRYAEFRREFYMHRRQESEESTMQAISS
ncbi:MAG: tRNA guanosine(34) transglycosylase Tgt [Deltaproteobacteria bacterium]|nr:tRNA guanosine(34) transglycosylase Tgt [Deltaproteobacteria bacterium]MBW2306457.1 tRNA guanosine(34) transglycosylase Tgt [Deltaproteobacteria bacterium]